jgi:hypothetical protein
MHTAARILAPLLLTLGLLAGHGAAQADEPPITIGEQLNTSAPSSVHRGARTGTLEAGWVRAACATNAHGARCVIRVPEGARRVVLDHAIGAKWLGEEVSYIDRAEHRTTPAPSRRAAGTLAGVRLECTNAGQLVECAITYPAATTDLVVTTFVRGWNYGGLRAKGLELAKVAA